MATSGKYYVTPVCVPVSLASGLTAFTGNGSGGSGAIVYPTTGYTFFPTLVGEVLATGIEVTATPLAPYTVSGITASVESLTPIDLYVSIYDGSTSRTHRRFAFDGKHLSVGMNDLRPGGLILPSGFSLCIGVSALILATAHVFGLQP